MPTDHIETILSHNKQENAQFNPPVILDIKYEGEDRKVLLLSEFVKILDITDNNQSTNHFLGKFGLFVRNDLTSSTVIRMPRKAYNFPFYSNSPYRPIYSQISPPFRDWTPLF
jgi:hypothetical protein